MIDAKYIDHSGLRNEYSVTPIKEFFEGFYLQDVTMSIGTHTGSVSVRKMERLFAIVSQIQYYLKMSGASMWMKTRSYSASARMAAWPLPA